MVVFKFNGDYNDLKQVDQFYEDFKACKVSIEGRATNHKFKGKIAAIQGDDEDTAIYLLQQLDTEHDRQERIKKLRSTGYENIVSQNGGFQRYKSVVRIGNSFSRSATEEYPEARIFFAEGRMFIVPKGNRTRGYNVWPDQLVLVK